MMAQLYGEMLRRLVDDAILPLDVTQYAVLLQESEAAFHMVLELTGLHAFLQNGRPLLGRGL